MNKTNKITLIIIILTILGYAASFLIPSPVGWAAGQESFHWTLANSVLYTLLHIGAAVLLLVGVSSYKAELRTAYIKIAAGIVLVGAGLAQVVFLNIFGLIQSPWVQYGGVMLPFVVAGLAIYFGTRAMARLVGVTSPLTKVRVVLPILLILVAIAAFMPHGSTVLPELFFDVSNAISVWDVVLYAASLGLVLQIKSHSGTYYTESMAWLALGLMGSVIITLTVLAMTVMTGQPPEGLLIDILVAIGGLLYLKAGHSFVKTREL